MSYNGYVNQPEQGTVMFDTMEGKAICNICLSMVFISNVLFKRTQRYAEKEKQWERLTIFLLSSIDDCCGNP